MELTLIRHLPTAWNEKGVLQGIRDIPILEVSGANKEEIEKNKEQLKFSYSLVLTSALLRTQQTAKAYGYNHFEIEPLLNELHFGEFEGKEKQQLVETHKHNWYTNPREIVLGEKIADLETRIITFIEKYKNYESILVFGHGSWIRACLSYHRFGNIDQMNQLEIKNNQLLTIEVGEEELKIGRHHI
ncbi:histidine phosphatase family protein [Fredinandcohnia sp. QZ13]|uniref:histidine phosphatase family protein n=1 Tax=Fredinandcohnia sp. QZ13 TaxID=3073144 RepID=UPI0028530C73|nr:histidine phosphatase family protein [Fredinandcohnia sp. QZ13]MDR4888599.1 histidine phosphatase family protein [Fredinandcohnia sp. QZ13]